MTNAEKIPKDTELLVRMIECQHYACRCNYCAFDDGCDCAARDCEEGIKAWLESEAEE